MLNFLILYFTIINVTGVTNETNAKCCTTNYPKENVELIKKTFKPGKHTNINAEILNKILIGEWQSGIYYTAKFTKDGNFYYYNWEASNNGYLDYSGKWKTKDNTIVFKLDGTKTWQECRIEYFSYEISTTIINYKHNFFFFFSKLKIETNSYSDDFLSTFIAVSCL